MNVYRSVKREQVENYLYSLTYQLIEGVVEEQSENLRVTEEQKKFIADFIENSIFTIEKNTKMCYNKNVTEDEKASREIGGNR